MGAEENTLIKRLNRESAALPLSVPAHNRRRVRTSSETNERSREL